MHYNIGKDIEKSYVRPMRLRWRQMLTSNLQAAARWDRWDLVALVLAVFIALWIFALKLKTFYDLGYSSDLFTMVQAARSWLEGKGVLQDNYLGNLLAVHTCFLLLPLGLIAKPFGAPGLLFVLAASVGAAYFCATRILRLLGVNGRVALIAAAAMLVSPFSVAFYQEWAFGFHVEVLALTLCLVLFYFLLQRRMVASIVTALAVISLKEDAPIAAAMVAIVAAVETWISEAGKRGGCRINWPAAVTLLLSVSAIPLLLAICLSQTPTPGARRGVDRLDIVAPGTLSSTEAVFGFVASHITHWLESSVVRQWLWVMLVGSFGTILLRPWFLVLGIPTTVVAWMKNRNDLLWAPRFFPTAALLWCITLVGFALIVRIIPYSSKWTRAAMVAVTIAIAAFSAFAQLALVPPARSAYLLRSGSFYSPQDRQEADAVFAHYRREGKPEEPVIASTFLFRYAHDRNLFWLDRLHGRPAPIWILGDSADPYVRYRISADMINASSGIKMEDYTVIDHRGRFVLLRRKDWRQREGEARRSGTSLSP
ncbi:MAG: hypothetical protein DME98_15240 [Verrucomicrobia bacterium]|nr:MAG: hypothetical protein DME98_15240 [Verrucomicrobiota bacterium]